VCSRSLTLSVAEQKKRTVGFGLSGLERDTIGAGGAESGSFLSLSQLPASVCHGGPARPRQVVHLAQGGALPHLARGAHASLQRRRVPAAKDRRGAGRRLL